MKRIFLLLASLNSLALLTTFAVGVVSKLTGGIQKDDFLYPLHYYLGLFTVIIGPLAIHCLIFIYFLGTGRWVKEVALAYKLPDEPWPRQTRELKRRTFPPALFAMLIAIATAAAGLGNQLRQWPWEFHGTLALLTLILNAWAFIVEYRNVSQNADIITQVLIEVDRIRAARGLPSNAEQLAYEKEVQR